MILSMDFQGRSLTASAQVEYVIEKNDLLCKLRLFWYEAKPKYERHDLMFFGYCYV